MLHVIWLGVNFCAGLLVAALLTNGETQRRLSYLFLREAGLRNLATGGMAGHALMRR